MADETPSSTTVVVSALQVVSATIQNVAVVAVIAYAWLIAGKLDTSVALGALFTVVGIDFANRARSAVSKTAALAFGSTGVLSHFLGLTGVALVLASGLASCGAAGVDLKPYHTVMVAGKDVYQELCVPLPESPAGIQRCQVALVAVEVGIEAYNAIEHLADAGTKP